MNAAGGAKLFAVLAILLFIGLLVRVFILHGDIDPRPCDKISATDNATVPAGSAPSVAGFFPDKIWLGAPLCVALAGPPNAAVDKDGKPTALHLFLDGIELKDAMGTVVNRDKNLLLFDVARSTDDAAVWSKIISQHQFEKRVVFVPVDVGVGTDKDGEFKSAKPLAPLQLMVVDLLACGLGGLAFIAAVLALILAAKDSAILCDGGVGSPYSLGRVQMAVWLYLITAAFVFIWLVTGDYNGILTSQALTLLGISGTTGLMAVTVDRMAVVPQGAVPIQAATTGTKGFWNDILNDSGGPALHRLQIVVWTAILGVVFLAEIYGSFRLPTFDSNLLILLGISGVTYVGFKFNEK